MKHLKKLLTVVLAVALALYPQAAVLYGTPIDLGLGDAMGDIGDAVGLFITRVKADQVNSGTFGKTLTWAVEDGVLTISGQGKIPDRSVSTEGDVTTYGDHPWEAYYTRDTIHTVVIAEGITSLGDHCFRDYTAMTSVQLPDGLTAIGENAFDGCVGLRTVDVPLSLTKVEDKAFVGCSGLEEVHITDLDAWAQIMFSDAQANPLYEAHNLYLNGDLVTEICISEGVLRIGSNAFAGCLSLTSAELPHSLTLIGEGVFAGCASLQRIVAPFVGTRLEGTYSVSLGYWFGKESFEGGRLVRQSYDFYLPIALTEVTITAASSLPNNAFMNVKLQTLTLPDHMTTLSYRAFCYAKIEELHLPSMLTEINEYAFCGSSLTDITLPETVTQIGEYAFYECKSLSQIYLNEGLTAIGPYAFDGCSALTNVYFPNSLRSIGQHAFSLTGLKTVTIPAGVTSVGSWVFAECASLEHVSFLASTSGVPVEMCRNCDSLQSFELSDTVTTIYGKAFYDCDALVEVVIPETVKTIHYSAFEGCANLRYLTLEEGVEEIVYEAFQSTNLQRVILPESLTTVGSQAFKADGMQYATFYYMGTEEQFAALETDNSIFTYAKIYYEVDTDYALDGYDLYSTDGKTLHRFGGTNETYLISESFDSIDAEAFRGLRTLKTLYWPSSIPVIGSSVLADGHYTYLTYDNDYLQTLYIPATVTAIEDGAFSYRDVLTDIYYAGTEEQWNAITIGESGNGVLKKATIHYNADFIVEDDVVYNTDKTELQFFGKRTDTYTLSEDVQTVREGAFAQHATLTSLCFAEGGALTAVPANLLSGCETVRSVYIPLSVTSLDPDAFNGSQNVTVYYQGDKMQWTALQGKYATVSNIILEHQHIFGEWTTLVPAQDGADAVEHAFCIDCGYEKTVTVAADHEHAYEKSVLYEPTCTMEGRDRYVCGCGLEYTDVIEELGHEFTEMIYDEWHRISEANCTNGALYLYECARCHAYSGNDLTFEDGEPIADAHEWDEGVQTQRATCSTEGIITYTCRHNAQHTFEMSMGTDLNVHTDAIETEAVEQTCTQDGYTAGVYCNDCETYIEGHDLLPALNHSLAYDVPAVEGSCHAYGYTAGTYCEDCDTYITGHEQLPMDPENHLTIFGYGEIPPSCTEVGYTASEYCNDCQTYVSGHEEIPALAHPDTEETAGVAPTETESGRSATVYCHTCNTYVTQGVFLPAVQDAFTDGDTARRSGAYIVASKDVTVADLLAQAYEGAAVSDADGNAVTEEETASTGMTLSVGGTVYFTVVTAGDVNGNGNVESSDVRMLLRFIMGIQSYDQDGAAFIAGDMDVNDTLTTADARLILKVILG